MDKSKDVREKQKMNWAQYGTMGPWWTPANRPRQPNKCIYQDPGPILVNLTGYEPYFEAEGKPKIDQLSSTYNNIPAKQTI